MSDKDIKDNGVLLVFAKSPEAGQVKTRLIPDIGVEAATKLYTELLTRTLSTAINSCFLNCQLWVSGNNKHSFLKKSNGINSFKLKQQTGKNLGERMFNAFEHVLPKYGYAVLIGCDCPGLTGDDLKSAANMLEKDKDIVIGPAEDGGYYLIGLKKNSVDIFLDIEWGSESVFSKTVSIVEKLNLNIGLLKKRNDIDRFSDIKIFEEIKKQEYSI